MNKSLIAILAGVAISITGCTNAGESTVSDYEQGGYFKEEQQIEQQKEVEKPKANTNTTQPTKINDKQPTESKHNSNRVNNQQQNKKSTKGVDKVKRNSESSEEPKQEPKHDNQSTQQNTQQEATDTVCTICGRQIYNGEDFVAPNDIPIDDGTGHMVYGAFIAHRECYEREFANGYRP
nr:MAG TPA: outer membrane protein assembly factor [Caudoviricetes sp.]